MSFSPKIYQISKAGLGVQFAIIVVSLYLSAIYFSSPFAPVIAVGFLFFAQLFLQRVIARDQYAGAAQLEREELENALSSFAKSYEFFSRHAWIDNWRFITMFSLSAMSYREIALLSQANCFMRLGRGRDAQKMYEKALAQFPSSQIAKRALQSIATYKELGRTEAENSR